MKKPKITIKHVTIHDRPGKPVVVVIAHQSELGTGMAACSGRGDCNMAVRAIEGPCEHCIPTPGPQMTLGELYDIVNKGRH